MEAIAGEGSRSAVPSVEPPGATSAPGSAGTGVYGAQAGRAPGLRGHYTFTSGQDQGRVVAVSVFDTRENAMRVSDRVAGIMRERAKDVALDPPRVTAGEAVVATAA